MATTAVDRSKTTGFQKLRLLGGEHWLFAAVFALGLLLRLGTATAYRPALFFSDSWTYVQLAYQGGLVGVTWDRPSGYPLLIHLLGPGGHVGFIPVLQHLAGLASGLLVYVLLLKRGAARWLAASAAALILLDGYAIALEQHLLPEAFFTFAVVGAFYLSVAGRRSVWPVLVAGLLLGGAVTLKSSGLFLVPIWLIYLLWSRRGLKLTALAVVAVVLPVLAHGALHHHQGAGWGLNEADGWFLYGRVGEIADCKGVDVPAGAQRLCDRRPSDLKRPPLYYVWNDQSPPNRVFGGMGPGWEGQQRSNGILQDFSLAVIRAHPGKYAGLVAGDFGRFFTPGVGSPGSSDLAIQLPARPRFKKLREDVRRRYVPTFHPAVHPPSGVVRAWRDVVHVPRPLVAVCVLLALAALVMPLVRRGRAATGNVPEIFLFLAAPLVLLLGSVATSDFVVRYLIPTVPLIAIAGALGLSALLAARRAGSGQSPA